MARVSLNRRRSVGAAAKTFLRGGERADVAASAGGHGVKTCASTRWRTAKVGAVWAASHSPRAASKAATSASESAAPTPRQARIRPRQSARVNGTSTSNQNMASTRARPAAHDGSAAIRPTSRRPATPDSGAAPAPRSHARPDRRAAAS
jgi:hypothetical protein